MKIYWRPSKEAKAPNYYNTVVVSFSEDRVFPAGVNLGFFIEGLVESIKQIKKKNEYVHDLTDFIYFVVRRIDENEIAVGIWGDYEYKKRILYTEEILIPEEKLSVLADTFIREIYQSYLSDDAAGMEHCLKKLQSNKAL